jgi:pimeloyl-ACP methyl ester carboxylesterase
MNNACDAPQVSSPRSQTNPSMIRRVVVTVVAAMLLVSALTFGAGWILSHPVQQKVGEPPPDLHARSVLFQSDNSAKVHGWWCPVSRSHGSLLLLPGVRANRLSMVTRAQFLYRARYSVLLIDLQGTGETEGDEITFGWRESRDVLAAVDFLRKADPNVPVVVIGSSLGGAAALLATPPLKVDAMVLESVYPTIEIATANRLEKYLGPLGRAGTPLLLMQVHARLGIPASRLHPVDHIANVGCPILIVSGAKDRNTTPEDTRMLFSQAREPKELWLVPNAGHVDLHQADTTEYESRILQFLGHISTPQPSGN